MYETVADRILLDLNRYGMNFHSVDSILAWHFTLIDNFAPMGHERVERILAGSFLRTTDWTCKENRGADWYKAFGKWSMRKEQIVEWLEKATIMQMTAACCIGNAYNSINLALTLAIIMEKYTGHDRTRAFDVLAKLIEDNSYYGPYVDIIRDFNTFSLYYGIHLDEEGPILDDIIADEDDVDTEEELDVDDLEGRTVTVEQLVGRNYYHYTDCEMDRVQPASYTLSDIDMDESEEELEIKDEDEDEEENEEANENDYSDESDDLGDYLPDDCWVKRFVDDNDPNTCYLLYLSLDEDGNIDDSGCISELSQRMGAGNFIFTVPGMELPSIKYYEYESYPPDKVVEDLRSMFKGRVLPLDFSFKGKRLPQAMIEADGNGGSSTEYTYALHSAYRLAYMHISIDTDENDVIEDFSYSTYQSSGSDFGDMFSRPEQINDSKNEIIEMLLYIIDQYTDEEYAKYII